MITSKLLVTATSVAILVAVLAASAATAQPPPTTGSTDSISGGTKAASTIGSSQTAARRQTHHRHMASSEKLAGHKAYAAPAQPIPYAQLDQYLKASPRERMAMAQQTNTGGTGDVWIPVAFVLPPNQQQL